MFVTDVKGIMKDENMISSITPEEIKRYISDGVIHGGMIPKVNSAVAALTDQVDEVMIVSGTGSFLAKHTFIGTKIRKQKEAVS